MEPTPYRYNGKERVDAFDLGWYDYGARWYAAELGRWGSVDPLADEPEQVDKSPYAYVWNNPIKLTDPDGKCPSCIGAAIGASIDYATQVAENLADGKDLAQSLTQVDGQSILISAVLGGSGGGIVARVGKAIRLVDKADNSAKGVVYKRVDKTGKQKVYVGQAKSQERYKARQKEHQRSNPNGDYEFSQIDKGKPGKDLNQKEQKHLDNLGGPSNRSNPNGGTSNKKNVIKKN